MTIFVRSVLELLQIVSEPNMRQCVSDDVGPQGGG